MKLIPTALLLVVVFALVGCGAATTKENTTGGSTSGIDEREGLRKASGAQVCPPHPQPLAALVEAAAAVQPVAPQDFTSAWACLYSHARPLNGANGQTLAAARTLDRDRVEPLLDRISSLAPRDQKACTQMGGGLFDALVLVNESEEVFPMLIQPRPTQLPGNCGVISTPKGYLELGGSDRITRMLFAAAGVPFPY